jgi:hypothetical protein
LGRYPEYADVTAILKITFLLEDEKCIVGI